MNQIDGTLGTTGSISCTLDSSPQISGTISPSNPISGEIDKRYISPEDIYRGSYTVVPKVDAQTLLTQGLYMEENVSILKIPYYQTVNPQGGNTAYIADSV